MRDDPGGRSAEGMGVAVRLLGVDLVLRGDGGVWRPAKRTLFVADLHLGKGAVFRARGVPVPAGDSAADLARLDAAVGATAAERLVVLGDLAHGPGSFDEHVVEALAGFRRRHPGLRVTVVRGNHDRAAGDPPSALGFEVVGEPTRVDEVEARHHPPDPRPDGGGSDGGSGDDDRRPCLAGHLHPVVSLREGPDRHRLPCFWWRTPTLVLPAWGRFTGGHRIRPVPGDRVVVLADGDAVEVPLE